MKSLDAPLERTFIDLPADHDVGAGDIEFLRGLGSYRDLTWEQLLEADRVLILSEAGMGKTHECKLQQRRLFDDGQPAFFLELASLVNAPMESQLDPEERRRLDSWKAAQSERAYFFLDSIDELKITSTSFEITLRQVATTLADYLDRVCIVITTRPGPDDRDLVRRLLPVPNRLRSTQPETEFADAAMRKTTYKGQSEAANPRWRFVALAPLDESQMHALASAQGVTDPPAMIAAIESEHAEAFAKRPLDFIELCGGWKAHGRIPGHRDQIEASITSKLQARSDRRERAEISPAEAREGAERLALAALLMRRFTLWHGHDADRGRGDGALDPRTILLDWSDLKSRTLLQRALFGFATYGRVRFHNRSVIEYLAAQRLLRLRKRGLPLRTLHRLIFATSPEGVELIRPSMEAIAAWVAADLEPIRIELLKRDPSVLLRFADPGALSPSMRAQALIRYVEMYGAGGWRGLHVPALQARRLATDDLVPTIQQVWATRIENVEVREALLELIEAGRLVDCAGVAYEAATDHTRDARERLVGLQALTAIKDARLPSLLDRMAEGDPQWSGELAAAAVVHLFPVTMSVAQLLGILPRVTFEKHSVGGIPRYLPDAIGRSQMRPGELEALRLGLTSLIAKTAHWEPHEYRIRADHEELANALRRVCELQIHDRVAHEALAESCALALQLSRSDDDYDEGSKPLRDVLAKSPPALRRKTFWAQCRLITAVIPTPHADARLERVMWSPGLVLNAEQDQGWMQQDLGDVARSLPERRIALECLIQFAQGSTDRVAALKSLRPFVQDVKELATYLEELIVAFENPRPAPKWQTEQEQKREDSRRKELIVRASWIEFWRELSDDRSTRYDPSLATNTAVNLAEVMSRVKDPDGRYSGWNRGFLERVFGKERVERLRQIMIETWRAIRPTLPSERPEAERNLYYANWRAGLVGLYAEAEDPQWARRLTPAEAELAMRYALTSMHGLPSWIDSLAQAHPDVVRNMLGPELQSQLDASGPESQHSSMLQYIAHAGPGFIALFIEPLRKWLARALSTDADSLHAINKFERTIDVLMAHGTGDDVAFLRAASLEQVNASKSQEAMLFWLPLLMRLAPPEAVDQMEQLAERVTPAANSVVTQWVAAVAGHHARGGAITDALLSDAGLLLRLALLAYKHVRIQDDRPRDGVRTSSARDDAEFARGQLGSMLLKAKGANAWKAKLTFSNDQLAAHFKDRALTLAKQELAEEFDSPTYGVTALESLERILDVAPVTRGDMAALLMDRLDELSDLLRQDGSPRELWSQIKIERLLRRAVGKELATLAKGAYSMSHEEVTGDEKETDLRLRSNGYDLEAVIELKVGENGYTVDDFRKALSEQLVGQYMRPEARRVGCLLISIATARTWEHPSDRHVMQIEDVINVLQEQADDIAKGLGYESLLMVRALDLRDPIPKRPFRKVTRARSGKLP